MYSALLSIKIQKSYCLSFYYFFDMHLLWHTFEYQINSLSDCHHEIDWYIFFNNIWDASNKKITFEFEMALVLWNVRMEFENIWYRCEMVRLYLILAQMIWRTYHQKMFFLYQFFIVHYWPIPKNRSMSEVVKSV